VFWTGFRLGSFLIHARLPYFCVVSCTSRAASSPSQGRSTPIHESWHFKSSTGRHIRTNPSAVFTRPLTNTFHYCLFFARAITAAENLNSPQPPLAETAPRSFFALNTREGTYTPPLATPTYNGGFKLTPSYSISIGSKRSDITSPSPFGLRHPDSDVIEKAALVRPPSDFDHSPRKSAAVLGSSSREVGL
jgi:hypothetical protein